MTDNMKQFLETASRDKELIEKLNQAPDMESVIALAKENGFTLTEEDLRPKEGIQEISDEEIEAVAGGKKCYCFTGGGGEKTEENEGVCACVLFGLGEQYKDGKWIGDRCGCFYSGIGQEVTE